MPAKQLRVPEHLRADPVTDSVPGSRFIGPGLGRCPAALSLPNSRG